MAWQRARFKGQDIWAKVLAEGKPEVEGGRVPIRYQAKAGAKVYRAAESRIELVSGGPLQELDAGEAASEPGKKTAAKKAGKPGTPGGFGKAGTRTAAQAAMAVEAARAVVEDLEGTAILCFTDGACKGNPGPAGSGASVWLPDGRKGEASRSLGKATNNVAELTAIGMALELLDAAKVPVSARGAILTDSAYAHGVLARGWKAKANQELVASVKSALERRPELALHWIAGHVGIEGNERADALANAGVAGRTEVSWS